MVKLAVVMPNNRKVHVQSIAKSWGRERLAEDIVNLKNQIHEASDREQKLQVCKRRLEAEVQALQSNLNKAEEILHKKTCTSSPNKYGTFLKSRLRMLMYMLVFKPKEANTEGCNPGC